VKWLTADGRLRADHSETATPRAASRQ